MNAALEPEPPVIVEGAGSEFAQHITAGVHDIVADESVAAGGRDTGPSPYQLLLAALGSCTSMTLGLYARRKRWPLARVRVELSHSKMAARDGAGHATNEAQSDRITRVIQLDGPLSSDQRQRLMQIATRCPVHRSLTSHIDIVTSVTDTQPPRGGDSHGTGLGEPAIDTLSATVAS
jgi:putative redox protein